MFRIRSIAKIMTASLLFMSITSSDMFAAAARGSGGGDPDIFSDLDRLLAGRRREPESIGEAIASGFSRGMCMAIVGEEECKELKAAMEILDVPHILNERQVIH